MIFFTCISDLSQQNHGQQYILIDSDIRMVNKMICLQNYVTLGKKFILGQCKIENIHSNINTIISGSLVW